MGVVAGCGDDEAESGSSGSSTTETSGGESGAQNLEGQQLVFVNYGGATADAAKAAWIDPFQEEFGVKMTMDAPTDPAKVKAMVQSGQTTWDVIDIDPASGASQCGTLYEELSPEVDVSQIDEKYMTSKCGVPIMVQAIALVYNKEMFGDNPPTKITDFMDTEKFPGKRTIFNYAVGGLEPILLADGVDPEQLFPLDFDRAEKAIQKLGNNLVFHGELAQQAESLVSGDFAMCLCYTARAAVSAEDGANIGVVWEHMFEVWDELYAIKGSKSPEAQQAFLNFVAQPEQQAAFTENLPYGPTTPSSEPELSETFKQFVPAGHEDEIGTPGTYDAQWWTDNADAAFAAWTDMTAG
jgi:putative spermidine/putrescine transport system substrate-binding protein